VNWKAKVSGYGMIAAYAMTDVKDARNALLECVRSLERINPSAAASLKEPGSALFLARAFVSRLFPF